MLFDPKWETKTEISSEKGGLDSKVRSTDLQPTHALVEEEHCGIAIKPFAAWLAQQPAGKPYDFSNIFKCAAAQYLEHKGVDNRCVSMAGGPPGSVANAIRFIASGFPRTFGAAAERARMFL